MLLVFVVETNEKNDSDRMYLNKYLTTRYTQVTSDAEIVVKWVYMNGKTNYTTWSVCKKVSDIVDGYKRYPHHDDKIHVIYCIDIDSGTDSVKLNKEIEAFCCRKKYHLIWFNKTIEQVFLGKTIHQSKNKKKEAVSFYRKEMTIDECCGECYCLKEFSESRLQTSNIGFVLEGILGQC